LGKELDWDFSLLHKVATAPMSKILDSWFESEPRKRSESAKKRIYRKKKYFCHFIFISECFGNGGPNFWQRRPQFWQRRPQIDFGNVAAR
jgi:hypothetical protein